MNTYEEQLGYLGTKEAEKQLARLYGTRDGAVAAQKERYAALIRRHEAEFGHAEGLKLISAPGRTEIGGNHTDHNRGKVLAAAVNLDTLAAVTPRQDLTVRLNSEGYAPLTLSLEDLSIREEEKNTTAALVRGVAARLRELGRPIGGLDAVVTSTVAGGSGLSSSAAVEVLLCAIFGELFGEPLDYKQRAIVSQFAENVYFGKPSGLMDQMASSAGGLVYIDFGPDDPVVEPIQYDFAAKGYALAVVNSHGSHANLTPEYSAIPVEMRKVAAFFGEENLRSISPETFYAMLPEIRKALGTASDRALLRAGHFYGENARVDAQAAALRADDLPAFLRLILESGRSSFCYLQNIFPDAAREEVSLSLMLADRLLRDCGGAWRVHGGGFAGTSLAFVPLERVADYAKETERVFGPGSCTVLDIRPVGPAVLGKDPEI